MSHGQRNDGGENIFGRGNLERFLFVYANYSRSVCLLIVLVSMKFMLLPNLANCFWIDNKVNGCV